MAINPGSGVNVMNDITLSQDKFVYVKNIGDADFDGIFNSKHYKIKKGDTVLANYYLFVHFVRAFDNRAPGLAIVEEREGSIEFARARARQLEHEAGEKIEAAQKAAAEANKAKEDLAQARVAAREGLPGGKGDGKGADDGKEKK